jgi:hypothetical protein
MRLVGRRLIQRASPRPRGDAAELSAARGEFAGSMGGGLPRRFAPRNDSMGGGVTAGGPRGRSRRPVVSVRARHWCRVRRMPPDTRETSRPDPDALMAAAAREGRGRLKVFLGAAPGVGKTWEMLAGARIRRAEGVDVVIGVVETHGRGETEARPVRAHAGRSGRPHRRSKMAGASPQAFCGRHPLCAAREIVRPATVFPGLNVGRRFRFYIGT